MCLSSPPPPFPWPVASIPTSPFTASLDCFAAATSFTSFTAAAAAAWSAPRAEGPAGPCSSVPTLRHCRLKVENGHNIANDSAPSACCQDERQKEHGCFTARTLAHGRSNRACKVEEHGQIQARVKNTRAAGSGTGILRSLQTRSTSGAASSSAPGSTFSSASGLSRAARCTAGRLHMHAMHQ